MKNQKLLIGCALALIALACGSGPARPIKAIDRLATLTPTGAAAEVATLAPVPTETKVPAETFTPEPTMTPIPATDAPAATETFTPEPATAIPPTVAPEAPSPVPATPVPPPVATAACECSADTYNCDDALAQTCFAYCNSVGAGDIHRLDQEGDGLACEGD